MTDVAADDSSHEATVTIVSGMSVWASRLGMLYVWATLAASVVLYGAGAPPLAATLGLLGTLFACLIVTWPGADRLPATMLAILLICVVSNLAVSAFIGFGTTPMSVRLIELAGYCLGLVAVRGHLWTSGVGGLLIAAGFLGSVVITKEGAQVLGVAWLPLLAVLVGFTWNRILARSVLLVRAHREAEQMAIRRENAEAASAARLEAQIRSTAASVLPLLHRIERGGVLTTDERARIREVEATLRDRLRVPRLTRPSLVDAVASARARGVVVVLLDASAQNDHLPERVLDDIEGVVRAAERGRVTVRLLPPGRDALGTVLLAEDDWSSSTFELR